MLINRLAERQAWVEAAKAVEEQVRDSSDVAFAR